MTNHSHRVASATNFVVAAPTSSNLRSSSACPVTASNGAQRPVHTTLIDEAWDLQPTAASTSQSGARRIGASPPRTSLIDAEWDQADDERAAHLSRSQQALARQPHTTLIDAEWDFEGVSAANEDASVPRPLQSSIVDLTWEELEATEVDEWDSPLADWDHESAGAASASVPRPLQSSIVELKPGEPQANKADGWDPPATVARSPQTSLIDSEWDSPAAVSAAEPPVGPKALALPRPIIIAGAVADRNPIITFVELDNPESLLGLLNAVAYK